MYQATLSALASIGDGVLLLGRTLRQLPSFPRQFGRFIEQCWFMGYATLPLVALLSFSIGAVLALQMGYSTRELSLTQYIGTIVGISLVRELGPVMTAIMVTGRVGSSVTAELAAMQVYQEVDALKMMNIPPERFLVLPRLTALLCVMPILCMVSIISGWIGGQVVTSSVDWIDLPASLYYDSLRNSLHMRDLTHGLVKAEVFAGVIALISCTVGLRTRGGPREIGVVVTRAVVACIIAILALDYFVTHTLI